MVLLGASRVVISGLISKVAILIAPIWGLIPPIRGLITSIRGLITPLLTTHEPPGSSALSQGFGFDTVLALTSLASATVTASKPEQYSTCC